MYSESNKKEIAGREEETFEEKGFRIEGIEHMPEEIEKEKLIKIPLGELTSMGVAFEPVIEIVDMIRKKGENGSGLYRVYVEPGCSLKPFKTKDGLMGAACRPGESKIASQAVLSPCIPDMTMIFLAAALVNIDRKLENIIKTQREISDFLKDRENSKMIGDSKILENIYSEYKYNFDNEAWMNTYRNKVVGIKHNSIKNIEFYKKRIAKKLKEIKDHRVPHIGKQLEKPLKEVIEEFTYYRLAVYNYAFSSFLEVLLHGNFSKEYLDKAGSKLDERAYEYRKVYTCTYNLFEKQYESSIEKAALKGIAGTGKAFGGIFGAAGNLAEKAADKSAIKVTVDKDRLPGKLKEIPEISISSLFTEGGEKVDGYREDKIRSALNCFTEYSSSTSEVFRDNIENLSKINSNPLEMIIDGETIYMGLSKPKEK